MANSVRRAKTSFAAGELAPELLGRGDLRAWENGARRLRNVFLQPTGGVTRRPGLAPEAVDALGSPPPRLPQMPAYHLVRQDRSGITMVNIGVGPANAKTITDHIAVLRPHAWMMLGHCAGLRPCRSPNRRKGRIRLWPVCCVRPRRPRSKAGCIRT